jgi:Family of unknown function (DUF6527)
MKTAKLECEFVEFVPEQLTSGIIYISMEYATASHFCCCGCRRKVVTPFRKKSGWIITFDGENVSLWPSIGNWSFPCRSHYIIREGRVEWAADMSEAEIAHGRQHDRFHLEQELTDKIEPVIAEAHQYTPFWRKLWPFK